MPSSCLILTAINAEAAALRRVGLDAVVIGIRGSRLGAVVVPTGTTRVIMAGVGGGLDPALSIGDVVVDAPGELVPAGSLPAGGRRGGIHTVDRVVPTVTEKKSLFVATGAAVVDMELSIVRDWAANRGLPVVGVRTVSDTADDVVDPAVIGFVNDIGKVRPLNIAATLVARPGLIGQLMRLDRNTRTALAALGLVVPAIAASLSDASRVPSPGNPGEG